MIEFEFHIAVGLAFWVYSVNASPFGYVSMGLKSKACVGLMMMLLWPIVIPVLLLLPE